MVSRRGALIGAGAAMAASGAAQAGSVKAPPVAPAHAAFAAEIAAAQACLDEWDHSEWRRREVIHAGADKVHIDTHFARIRKDGSLLGGFDSIYIVTRQDGRWGIQGRSSFAP